MSNHEHFGEELAHIKNEEAVAAVRRAARDDVFRFPLSLEAQGRVLDDVSQAMPGLARASYEFMDVIMDGQGWTDEQAQLLGTGFDMALIVLHELIRESRHSD